MQTPGPNPYAPNPYAPPNPYGAPQAVPHGYGVAPGAFAAWVDGQDLAVQKDAPLPAVCVKCGSHEATRRRNQQFVFTPPWVIVFAVISPLIGGIIALIVQKKGRLLLPLCESCHSRWTKGMVFVVLGALWLVLGFAIGIIVSANDWPEIGIPLILSAVGVFIAALIVSRGRFLRARKVDDRMITLRDVHPNAFQAVLAASQGR